MNRILSFPRHCRAHRQSLADGAASGACPGGHVFVDATRPSSHTTTLSTPALPGSGSPDLHAKPYRVWRCLATALSTSSPLIDQADDLALLRETVQLLFGEDELAVVGNLEHAAAGRLQAQVS